MLDSTPPREKKRKIGEHEGSPQLTPDKEQVGRPRHGHLKGKLKDALPLTVEQRLKKWKLDKEFTVHGGSRLGCITCMKYGAWCEQQDGLDRKKKEKKKNKEMKKKEKKEKKEKKKKKKLHEAHTEEGKSPRKSHGPAEADSGDEETTIGADIQHTFQKGTYKLPWGTQANRLRYVLNRHLSGPRHKKAAGARREEEDQHVKDRDVPSAAQMMFVYDEVKKSPMVPPLPPLLRGYYGYYGLIA